jgi:hypothetical protein
MDAYASKIAKARKKGLYSTQKYESFDGYVVSYTSLCAKFNDIDFASNAHFFPHKIRRFISIGLRET